MPGALAISVAPEALRLHLGAFCNLPRAALRLGAYDHLRVAAKSNSTAAGPRSLSRLSRRMDVDQAFDEIGAGCDVVVTTPTYFRPWLQPSATLRTESACDYRVGLADQCARYRTGPRSASTVRRSRSTAAFSIFRSARVFASTVSLSARLWPLGLPSFVVRGADLGGCREGCRLRIDGGCGAQIAGGGRLDGAGGIEVGGLPV